MALTADSNAAALVDHNEPPSGWMPVVEGGCVDHDPLRREAVSAQRQLGSFVVAKPKPFDHPFVVNLTQSLGILLNAFRPNETPLPASMYVDHVRVWR